MTLKPFTCYICPVGHGRLGHSSLYTGDGHMLTERDGKCVCGVDLVDEESTRDGRIYRLTFETIRPHDAAMLQKSHGRGIWKTMSEESWKSLNWFQVSKETPERLSVIAQYTSLMESARTRDQPIRNVRLYTSKQSDWTPYEGEIT